MSHATNGHTDESRADHLTSEFPMHARRTETTRFAGVSRPTYHKKFAAGVMAVSTNRRSRCASDTSELPGVTALFQWLRHSFSLCGRQLAQVRHLPRLLPKKTVRKEAEPELFPLAAELNQEPTLDDFPEWERQTSAPAQEEGVTSLLGTGSAPPAPVFDSETTSLRPELLARETSSPIQKELETPIQAEMSTMPAQSAPPADPPAAVEQASYPGSHAPPLARSVPSAPVFDQAAMNLWDTFRKQQEPAQQQETLRRLKPVFLLPESHEKPTPAPSSPPAFDAVAAPSPLPSIPFDGAEPSPPSPTPFSVVAELRQVSLTSVCDAPSLVAFPLLADERPDAVDEMEPVEMEPVWPDDLPVEKPALPPFSLMVDPGPKKLGGPTREDLHLIARTLEQKLADFRIKGQIVDVLPGPVVTTFELDPAPGLRAVKVIGLADDLARSISVSSVRVVGNVPGKTVIGIEIPNVVRQTVYLKEILTSEAFRKVGSPLAVALGSDIFGNPVAGNLAKMPHLLVAGTTGSGKSVAVNAMICSILFSATPDEVRFLMVDPKMLELSIYEGIPHLLAPVVTDVHKAANLLKWAVTEMENRYRLMSELGVRNLTGYNERIRQCIDNDEQPTRHVKMGTDPETGRPVEREEPIPLDTKPLIVIVIDELADLMIQVGKEVEPAIARLAQMARAAGLHLILATQRPSVDVITGLIKANFPTRLAFQVSSKIDSRTILDAMGADRLLGMGDGLFMPPGTSQLQRIHAPFVSDKEVHDLVGYLRSTGTPDYDLSVLIQRDGDNGDEDGCMGGAGGDVQDELYDQAVRIVLRERKVSTSMVQRVFKIGYNRAARMVEQMESEGLISAPNGAGKREVSAAV
ncbi:MAG: cell division protein FtsK [Magnetococcales bacterium]|nr:cell division protein FtsK [Magnetococcales bacterium]